jgi:hypothetical protein
VMVRAVRGNAAQLRTARLILSDVVYTIIKQTNSVADVI